jgi:hypothetical protein
LAGGVHATTVEDFSVQELTSQEPACATATAGEVWLVAPALTVAEAEAVTAEVPAELR